MKAHTRNVVSGQNIDDLYTKKQTSLFSLKDDKVKMTKENEQLKNLNTKLMARVDFLQQVIDKEASANTYYYNYPPKPEDDDEGSGSRGAGKKTDDSDLSKVKKMYENQMEMQRK
jgi:hypothetical protein